MIRLLQIVDGELESLERGVPVPAQVADDVRALASQRHPLDGRALGQRRHRHLADGQLPLRLHGQGRHARLVEHRREIFAHRGSSHGGRERADVIDRRGEAGGAPETGDRSGRLLLSDCGRGIEQLGREGETETNAHAG